MTDHDRKFTTKVLDTILLTCGAVFFFVMCLLYSSSLVQPAPYASLICFVLSLGCFAAASYRITH